MTDQEMTTPHQREVVIRPQVGLMLSIGEPPTGERNYPKKLDHFRPKPGSENQYLDAVAKFDKAYPAEQDRKRIDIVFISNSLNDVLDIRYKAWGTSGLRAIGQTNFALCPEKMLAFDDTLIAFPEDKPDSVEYQLKGPDDPIIAKVGLKLYGVLRFAIPAVTGLTTLAEISTTSKRTMNNWLAGVSQAQMLAGGQLAGLPFVLAVRPARTRFFDEKKKKRSTSTFYEVVLEAPHSIDEFMELVQTRRSQMSVGRVEMPALEQASVDRDREIAPALWANGANGAAERVEQAEPQIDATAQVREEPAPDRPDDARLNRLALLEQEVGEAESLAVLRGVFGVDVATELVEADAERYESMLRRNAEANAEDAGDGEIVEDDPFTEGAASDPAAAGRVVDEQAAGTEAPIQPPTSFADLIPDSAREKS
jgi:hypothetical protein